MRKRAPESSHEVLQSGDDLARFGFHVVRTEQRRGRDLQRELTHVGVDVANLTASPILGPPVGQPNHGEPYDAMRSRVKAG